MDNKVKFNIKNVHYAAKTENGYSTPVPIPGAVSIALEPQGELTPFYADGIKYYVSAANGGYEGDLVVALIPDAFRKDILGEAEDTNKVMIESNSAATKEFALGFDVDGDQATTSFWFYNCTATRPGANAQTNEENITPVTETITVSSAADTKGNIRAKSTAQTPKEVLNNWYKNVYVPAEAQS